LLRTRAGRRRQGASERAPPSDGQQPVQHDLEHVPVGVGLTALRPISRRLTMATTLEPMRDPVFTDWQLPTFSMEERERRWGRVRELMRRDGIDCIVGLNSTGTHNRNQADVRYLTQIGNNCDEVAVCFPIVGKVTAI